MKSTLNCFLQGLTKKFACIIDYGWKWTKVLSSCFNQFLNKSNLKTCDVQQFLKLVQGTQKSAKSVL